MLLRQLIEFFSLPVLKVLPFFFEPKLFVFEVRHALLQLLEVVGRFQVCRIQIADSRFQHGPGQLKPLCNFQSARRPSQTVNQPVGGFQGDLIELHCRIGNARRRLRVHLQPVVMGCGNR